MHRGHHLGGGRARPPFDHYVYGSAKGALSLFLQGLRSRLFPAGVSVITIKPGPVDTAMTDHMAKGAMFANPKKTWPRIFVALCKSALRRFCIPRGNGNT